MTKEFVAVKWIDIEGVAGTWTAPEDVIRAAADECICMTIGHIVDVDDIRLVMAASHNIRGEVADGATIPIGAVRQVFRIHLGEEIPLDDLLNL